MKLARCYTLDLDVIEFMKTKKNISKYLNNLIRVDMGNPVREEPEVKKMANIRVKNLYALLQMIDGFRYINVNYLGQLAAFEIGVSEKKYKEYIGILQYANKIIFENGWVVSKGYSGPMPWTTEGKKMIEEKKEKREASAPVDDQFEKETEEHINDILG